MHLRTNTCVLQEFATAASPCLQLSLVSQNSSSFTLTVSYIYSFILFICCQIRLSEKNMCTNFQDNYLLNSLNTTFKKTKMRFLFLLTLSLLLISSTTMAQDPENDEGEQEANGGGEAEGQRGEPEDPGDSIYCTVHTFSL